MDWDKILQWGGRVFAIMGIVFLILEAVDSIRKHHYTKLNVLGMIFLGISLVGFLLTELILSQKDMNILWSFLWIVFMWAYLICCIVGNVKDVKTARKNKTIAKQNKPDSEQTENVQSTQK